MFSSKHTFPPNLRSTVESVNRTMPTRSWLLIPLCKYLWFCQIPLMIHFLTSLWKYVSTLFTHALKSWFNSLRAQALSPSYSHNHSGTLWLPLSFPWCFGKPSPTLSPLLPPCQPLNLFFFVYIVDLKYTVFLWPKTPTFKPNVKEVTKKIK